MRLFAAIPLPETVQDAIDRIQAGLPGARWVPAENLHVTLRFVGEVDPPLADALGSELGRIDAASFPLRLSGLDLFGPERKPRSLHLRVERSEALTALQHDVERACQRAGCAPEGRRFIPHVTIARFSGRPPTERLGAYVQANNLFTAGPVSVTAFALMESTLRPDGPVYTELATFPLDPAA